MSRYQKPYSEVAMGELKGSSAAQQLSNVPAGMVRITALSSNASSVYLGGSGVTIPAGNTDATSGYELQPGEDTGWMPIDNLNILYMIGSNATDDISWLVLR